MPFSRHSLGKIARATTAQWEGIADRTPTYLAAYMDCPGSSARSQRRAEWLAERLPWPGGVLELGCAAGRNLAAIHRRSPRTRLYGCDINGAALGVARTTLPSAHLFRFNLYDCPGGQFPFTLSGAVDAVLTVGVLSHLHQQAAQVVIGAALAEAPRLVMVEHLGQGEVLKGPWWWRPRLRRSGDYVLWAYPWPEMVRSAGGRVTLCEPVPADLRAPGATVLLEVARA